MLYGIWRILGIWPSQLSSAARLSLFLLLSNEVILIRVTCTNNSIIIELTLERSRQLPICRSTYLCTSLYVDNIHILIETTAPMRENTIIFAAAKAKKWKNENGKCARAWSDDSIKFKAWLQWIGIQNSEFSFQLLSWRELAAMTVIPCSSSFCSLFIYTQHRELSICFHRSNKKA